MLTAALVVCMVLISSTASACMIPVFRYALERWEADRLLMIVYYDQPLPPAQDYALGELARQSALAGGPLNMEVVRFDLRVPSPPQLQGFAPPSNERPLPYVEIRARASGAQTAVRWQGPLADLLREQHLFDSPARTELVRRILSGHSAVWLLVAPAEQKQQLAEQLQATLDSVSRELALPMGIGLPGSELYASIPLEIRFSVLTISRDDPAEGPLLNLLASAAPQWKPDAAYVIPVFGRGRALDVFSFDETDELLVRDVGEFLCGACSCRVKQANPGFDLLTSVDWNQRLFGNSVPPPIESETGPTLPTGVQETPEAPQFVAIPTGNQPGSDSETALAAHSAEKPRPSYGKTWQRPPGLSPAALLWLAVLTTGAGVALAVVWRMRQAIHRK